MAAAAAPPPVVETMLCHINEVKRNAGGEHVAYATGPRGQTVFLNNRMFTLTEAQEGDEFELDVTFNLEHRNFKAVDLPQPEPRQEWEPWQLEAAYPETEPGEETGLTFVCWCCGTQVLTSEDISHLHGGAVWTSWDVDTVNPYGESAINIQKETTFQNAECANCQHKLGAFYENKYDSCPAGLKFPCFKLVCARLRCGDDRFRRYGLVLSRDSQDALLALQRRHEGGPTFQYRVNHLDFDVAEEVRRQLHVRD